MAKYTVKKALEDRKDRMKEEEYNARYQAALQAPEWYANRNKPLSVKEALNERKKRIDKDSSSIKNDIASRYNSVVNAFNDYAQTSPRFGEKAGEDTASIQKNNRQNIRSLVSDIKGYKSVIGEKEADKMLKALESMQGVYDSAYQAASKIYSNFDSKEDYQDFMNPTSDVIPVGNKALPSKDKNKVGGVYSFDSGMKNSAFDNLAFSGNKETLPADGVNDEDRLSMYIYFQQKAREARANGASKEDVNAFLAQAEKARTKEGYQELASGWLLYDNATDEETVNARKAIYERKLAELQRLESRIAYTPDGAEKDELVNQKEKVQSEVDAYDSIQKNKEMLVFDIEAGQKEVDPLQSASDEISSLENKKSRNSVSDIENALRRQGGYSEHDLKEKASAIAREQAQRNKDIDANISEILNKSGYNTVDELRRAVAEKRAYILQAKNLQRINEFSANARNSSDFEKYSSIGAAIENPSFEDAEKGLAIGTWRPFGETVNNPVTYSRENAVAIALENKEGHPAVGDFRYRSMTNEEVEVYNYYLAKEQAGQVAEGTAQSYLDSLDDILNQREAQDFAEAMKGNTALELAFGIAAGIDQFASGIKNLVQSGDEYIAPSMKQYISGEVREDLADSGATVFGKSLGQWGYDAVTTTANMLPSIAASYIIGQINPVVGEWVGSGLMGASAAGNEYASMINEGYSKGQARVASTLTGASEALLQKMLGGLPGLNGVLTDKAIEAFASGLKSAGAKLAVSLAGKVYAEGMEEFLQEVLSPYIKAFATGTTPEDVDWEEAIYSGILGAMTSLVFGGADTISNGVSLAKYNRETYAVKGAKIINSEDVRVLARYAEAAMSYGETYSDIDVKGISKYLGKVEKAIDRTGYYTNSDMVNIGKLYDLVSNAAATIISSPEVNIDSDGVSRAAQYAQEAVRQLTAPDTEQTTVPNTNPPTVQTAEQEAYVQEDKAKEPSSVEVPAQETEEITDNEAVQPQTDSVQTEAINAAERSERSAEALKFALDDIDDTNISKAAVDLIASEYDGVIPATEYVQGMQEGFKFGYSGIPESGLADYKGAFGQLSEMQKKHSYNLGVLAAKDKATARDSEVKGKIKTALENSTGENKDITVGRKKGVVQGKGVSLEDLKKTFNDTQNKAYKILSTVSEATGIDIVLYKSEADANGKFTGPQGKFKWSNDKIYIDLNAGLLDEMDVSDLGAYTLLRTFCHENVHFIEKWNELGYNDLRNLVFEELQNRGEDVDSLVREYAEKLGLDYDKASREVVAQSLTDILPDSNFVKKILDKNESLFRKILDKLKEFLEEVKAYFRSLGKNGARVADVLKEEINGELHYLQNVVDLFDKVAVQAVENYQMTFAVDAETEKGISETIKNAVNDVIESKGELSDKWNQRKISPIPDNISALVRKASDGAIDISDKIYAINGSDIWHEYNRHKGNSEYENGQIPLTIDSIAEAIEAFYTPDSVETVFFNTDNPTQRKSFCYTKKKNGRYIVVLAVGGKYNPNVTPSMILNLSEKKYTNALSAGKTIAEILFDNDTKKKKSLDVAKIKENKVIVARPESKDAGAFPHSPLFNDSISHPVQNVNTLGEASSGSVQTAETKKNTPDFEKTAKIAEKIIKATPKDLGTIGMSNGKDIFLLGNMQCVVVVDENTFNSAEVSKAKSRDAKPEKLFEFGQNKKIEGSAYSVLSENGKTKLVYIEDGKDGVLLKLKYAEAFDGYDFFYNPKDEEAPVIVKDANGATVGLISQRRKPLEGINTDGLETLDMKSFSKSEKGSSADAPKKIVFAQKKDFAAADIEYHIPGYKKPIAYSTKATADHLESIAEDNPTATISQIRKTELYDEEAYKVLDAYISNGLGNKTVGEMFTHDKDHIIHREETTDGKKRLEIQRPKSGGRTLREDNNGGVLSSDTSREGASRLLDEVQTEDVQRAGGQGDASENSGQRGRQVERLGGGTDSEAGSRGSDGSREVGDLRRDDVVNEAEKKTKDESLKKVVDEQIEQKSTQSPKGNNFVISDSLSLPQGEKARFRANLDAIKLVKKLESENRFATPSEQEVLSKYVGWGGLSNAFGEGYWNYDTHKTEMRAKKGWEKEFDEFKQLVTDGIISEDEYRAASASTKNAHYTSVEVIKAMYDGLEQLGFNGGRMLEPSAGVGNFIGAMPSALSSKVNSWTAVELDSITGHIAKYLYPNADVRIQGFEAANLPDNYMDVAIGNVPFGNYGITDSAYPKRVTKAIHNYFFAKALDKVRPGGIVMFITSSFTMNGKDTAIRQYIMDRADLLGAIRLPNNAFSENAGTQVVTDILVLKKREKGTPYAGEDFLNTTYQRFKSERNNADEAEINKYFANHPEMVLGTPARVRGMYGDNSLTYNPFTDRGPLGEQIRNAFKTIQGKMDYPKRISADAANFRTQRADKKPKQGGFVANADGKLFKNKDGVLEEVTDKTTAKRITGLLEVRDAYKTLINYIQQGQAKNLVAKARKDLNAAYDKFVKENGYINSPKNKAAIKDDPDSFSIYSLENYDAKTKKATKADIFEKDTIKPNRTINHVEDVSEGVIVSVNTVGGIDTELISKLTGKSEKEVSRELIDSRMAFKTKDGQLETPERYLSGNVRAKLREAEALVPFDNDFQNNVEELKKVVPKDIPYNDIYVALGTPWIPASVYADFIANMLGSMNISSEYRVADVEVERSNVTGSFSIRVNNNRLKKTSQNIQRWGTSRKTFLQIVEALMSSRSITVKDTVENEDGRKTSVVNKVETAAAQEKAEEVAKKFQEWLWQDETRKKELSELYNNTFNAIVTPKYDGSHLAVNGLNAEFSLREHQANAVQRIIASGGNTLLAHKVGAGKTLEMASAAMKLKELGIIKKPMFVVPKSLVAQWGVEFKKFFPAARILVSDEKDFTPANRKTFSNKISNGDFDAVIVSYEQFEKVPLSAEYQKKLYEQQKQEAVDAIAEARAENGGRSLSIKELEKILSRIEAKIELLTRKEKDEANVDFEQLGVDSLFVDEAHNFKNLFYTTNMSNISGLGNSDGSQRSFDLYSKVRYLQGMNGGRGIVFATATPVMNSMAEMYIMQKYLQSDMLKQLGLLSFDDWAKQFGEVVNSVEIKPSGQGFRVKQSFSNFKNLNELQLLFRSFSDVLTHVDGLKIPKMKGGKVKTIVCEPGEFQKNYMKELEERAENVKSVNPKEDNMLKITSDGRKVAYTQRMIDPSLPYEAGCKVFKCCENVIEEYKSSSDIKGTQIVFCDMATPKGADKKKAQQSEDSDIDNTELDTGSAKLYDDMKSYLVKNGIPASEIAFIHDAKTDAAKKQLFEDVNNGTVRVLIGSTGKMGVGMNAQKRIVAIHHLDAPWRPGDVEQRDGRAFRQGNINDEVSKYTYVTKGSFDARLWDILDRKQHFINQIMEGENVGRTAEDTGDVTLSAAEVKALASGNPLIMEQVQLSNELQKLENLQKAHRSSVLKAQSKVLEDGQKIVQAEKTIERISADIETRVDTYSEGNFSMTVDGKTYTDKKEAGVALLSSITLKASTDKYAPVGKFAGFTLYAAKDGVEYSGIIKGQSSYKFNVYMSNTTQMINKICATVADLETRLKAWKDELARTETDLAAQEEMAAEPFAKQEELDKKLARFNEVMKILNPQDEQQIADGEDEQYQSRKLLEGDEESFPTIGVHWGIADGILTKTDARAVWEAIANIQNRGFRGYPKTVTGEHYIESGNKLMIVDTNFRHPRVETIFVFNDTSETNMSEAKELLIDAEGVYERLQNAWEAIRDVQGDEYVSRYDCEDSPSYARKNPGREGTNRGADNSGIDEQQQERTETLTDRRVLEIAASELDTSDLTEGEIFALNTFKKRLENIRDLQAQRKEQGSLYKEQQFGSKSDRSEAVKTLNRMNILDEQIRRESAELLSVEEKEVLKRVLQRSRKVIEKKDREETKQLLRRQSEKRKEAEAVRKYRQRIKLDVSDISSWITNPNNKTSVNRVPDILKNSVIPFLTSIDLTSKRQLRGGAATRADREFADRLEKMQEALKTNGEVNGLYSGYNDLPPDFTEHLQSFVNAVHILTQGENDSYVINRMTGEQLKDLSKIVRTLKKFIKEMNMFHYNAVFSHVSDAAENTISSLREINNAGNSENGVSNFIFWKNIRPAYAFERFGEGGKAIYDEFRRAQSTLAFHAKEIIDFAEKAYTTEEVKAWRKDYKEFNLDGDTVKMPVSYIMGLYELSKQPDSLRHILGDGIRIARHTFGKEKIQDVGHRLSESDVQEIIGVLSERQKEVADALQNFMATQGAAWGNYVSVKRFGERLFTNPQYYPISSDGRYLESSADEQPQAASLYALLNMSFTKKRNENADNRIVIFDIFDVFANHMASMAQYNAFALPILDALKWFNYKQVLIDETTGAKEVIGSVRDEMNRVYGGGNETRGTTGGYAENFVKNIIKAYNGTESQGNPDDSLGLKALRAYNVAQIAFNGRVVTQQPLAITRAGTVINYSDIIKGLKLKPSSIKANIDEMYKYSGIALWKSLGFYDINISRGLTDIIKHDSSLYDKAIEVGLKGAEKADEITWSAMWSACKEAVKKKQPYLNVGSPEFFETVAKLFEEVIYKTQVVDSVLTKSEFIRGKGFFARATSSFMSEPVTTASMVTDAYFSFKTDRRKGMSFNQAWRKHGKKIGRLTYVYVLGAFALAALVSFMDAAGDDDDESYGKKYLDAFVGNFIEELIPFNKLPVVSDAYDIVKSTLSAVGVDTYGNPPQTVFAQWYDSLMKGVEIVADKVSGESTGYTWYGGVSKLLQAVSGMTGLPLAAATREVVTVWNNTVGAINSDLKVRKYAGSNNASNAEDYLSLIAEGNKKESTELYNQWVEERKEQIAENREKDGKVPLSDTELEKEARSGVKSSISAQLRPKYIEAYRNGDNETMASIRKQMFATGLYVEAGKNPADVVLKTCNNWIEDYIQN